MTEFEAFHPELVRALVVRNLIDAKRACPRGRVRDGVGVILAANHPAPRASDHSNSLEIARS